MLHLKVYALADMMLQDDLKAAVTQTFGTLIESEYKSMTFPHAVKTVYEITPPGVRGQDLRATVIKVAVIHAVELFDQDENFAAMMDSVAEFRKDLAFAMAYTYQLSPNDSAQAEAGKVSWSCSADPTVCQYRWMEEPDEDLEECCPLCCTLSPLVPGHRTNRYVYKCPRLFCSYYLVSFTKIVSDDTLQCRKCPSELVYESSGE